MDNRLISILGAVLLLTSACSHSGGNGDTASSYLNPSPTPVPTSTPAPTPTPTATPCADLLGTHWIADGNPLLTSESQDQLNHGPYIFEIDLSVSNSTFAENQYLSASSTASCNRNWNDGIPTTLGSTDSLTWTDTTGFCSAVVPTLQFNLSTCNELIVTLRDGQGQVYEIQGYKPL